MRFHFSPSVAILVLLAVVPLPVLAVDDATKAWLISIVDSQQSAERTVGADRQRGVWISRQGHCARVAVMHLQGGATENYKVCATRAVPIEGTPATPDAGQLREARATAANNARTSGEYLGRFGDFEIRAVRLGNPDAAGCAEVETTLSHSLLLAGNWVTKACP